MMHFGWWGTSNVELLTILFELLQKFVFSTIFMTVISSLIRKELTLIIHSWMFIFSFFQHYLICLQAFISSSNFFIVLYLLSTSQIIIFNVYIYISFKTCHTSYKVFIKKSLFGVFNIFSIDKWKAFKS